MQHDSSTLIHLFDATFYNEFKTRLVKGEDEPLYRPARRPGDAHQIIFALGFFASALHEVAHWCIAGEKRRQQVDYGYWYVEDGRDAEQQHAFERVEVRPQAIEWAFSLAAGSPFRVSTDNLDGAEPDVQGFTQAVADELAHMLNTQLPPRAARFAQVLATHFGRPHWRDEAWLALRPFANHKTPDCA